MWLSRLIFLSITSILVESIEQWRLYLNIIEIVIYFPYYILRYSKTLLVKLSNVYIALQIQSNQSSIIFFLMKFFTSTVKFRYKDLSTLTPPSLFIPLQYFNAKDHFRQVPMVVLLSGLNRYLMHSHLNILYTWLPKI